MFAFAADDGFAERHGVIARGNFVLDAAVEELVFEEEHGIIVADAGL